MGALKAHNATRAAPPSSRGWGGALSFLASAALHLGVVGGATLMMIDVAAQGASTRKTEPVPVFVTLVEEITDMPDAPEEKTAPAAEDKPEEIISPAGKAPMLKAENRKKEEKSRKETPKASSTPTASKKPRPRTPYAGGGNAAKTRYQDIVRAHINAQRVYPTSARRKKLEGQALVRITVARNGRILYHHFLDGTGHAILDETIREMLRKSTPLPPVPKNIQAVPVDLNIPIGFYLK